MTIWMRCGSTIGLLLGLAAAATACGQSASAPSTRASAHASVDTPATWSGRYGYEFGDGCNAAGTGVTVSYRLTLAPGMCRFTAQGYQTDDTILCTAAPHANATDIRFKSYGDGKLTDKYGNPEYAVGDHLFMLEHDGARLLTTWKGYPLPDDKPHPKGVYFKRLG